MQDLALNLDTIMEYIKPEVAVVFFTIVGAIATSVIEIRKRKKLKTLGPASDSAFELAKEALETVKKASDECNRKFEELSNKYDALERKYHNQIEVNTRQSELISKLNIELLYFRTQVDPNWEPIDPEDRDPGFSP